MYSTCLFCHAPLGANDAIEHFPVGRRLAFEASKGRLWVVCRRCERWNLTPLGERWEAIEECERLFRDTRLRVSTDNIGLARLAGGMELVRIGAPQRPELAAWRYGDQFGRRRQRTIMVSAAGLGAAGAVFAAGAVGLLSVPMALSIAQWSAFLVDRLPRREFVARVEGSDGTPLHLREADAHRTALAPSPDGDGSLAVQVAHDAGFAVLKGPAAEHALRTILPLLNRRGGSAGTVRQAVARLEQARTADGFLRELAPATFRPLRKLPPQESDWGPSSPGNIALMPVDVRLAIEMAVNEEAERRALEGELAQLEAQWREAEEIAAIADTLLVPAPVDEQLKRLKGR